MYDGRILSVAEKQLLRRLSFFLRRASAGAATESEGAMRRTAARAGER